MSEGVFVVRIVKIMFYASRYLPSLNYYSCYIAIVLSITLVRTS